MADDPEELIPKKQSLFTLKADDIVDSALQNLDEKQAREVTKKAADEVVRLAVERRKAEYRSTAAQEEMRNLIDNANPLDKRGGDYKINSTFETATGKTNVEIQKSRSTLTLVIVAAFTLLVILLFFAFLALRN